MKITTYLIIGFFTITGISVIIGTVSLYQLSVLSESIEDLPDQADKLSGASLVMEQTSKILYYDEILTQSVRNYAFTQDVIWKERYFEFEPILNNTLSTALSLTPNDEAYFANIAESNKKLVDMELEAISLVDQGNSAKAIEILESEQYGTYKNRYAQFLNEYSSSHDIVFGQTSQNLFESIDQTMTKFRSLSAEGLLIFQITVVMLILLSLGLGYLISQKITRPFSSLRHNLRLIAQGKFENKILPSGPDEIKELFDEYNKTTKDLQRLDETKSNLTSIVSHELRTPLVPILGNIDLLLTKNSENLTDYQKTKLNKIKEKCLFLSTLISDIMDLNKINTKNLYLNKDIISLEEIIDDVLDSYQIKIKEKKLTIEKSIKQAKIDGDRKRLTQVFSNLVSNALDFSSNNGKITITTQLIKDKIHITFKDSGRGISPDKLDKIFETYYQENTTSTREHGGAGIGLAVCKGIIQSHGGKIWAESEGLDKGTQFHIILPIISNKKND